MEKQIGIVLSIVLWSARNKYLSLVAYLKAMAAHGVLGAQGVLDKFDKAVRDVAAETCATMRRSFVDGVGNPVTEEEKAFAASVLRDETRNALMCAHGGPGVTRDMSADDMSWILVDKEAKEFSLAYLSFSADITSAVPALRSVVDADLWPGAIDAIQAQLTWWPTPSDGQVAEQAAYVASLRRHRAASGSPCAALRELAREAGALDKVAGLLDAAEILEHRMDALSALRSIFEAPETDDKV